MCNAIRKSHARKRKEVAKQLAELNVNNNVEVNQQHGIIYAAK